MITLLWLHISYSWYLLCFFLARICDRLSGSGCRCRGGCAAGGGRRGCRRERIRVIDKGLSPLSLLDHLDQAVGHEHDDDGGYGEAWGGKGTNNFAVNTIIKQMYMFSKWKTNHLWGAAVWQPTWQSLDCSRPGCWTAQCTRSWKYWRCLWSGGTLLLTLPSVNKQFF